MRWGTLLWCGVSRLPWLRACEAAFISLTWSVPFDNSQFSEKWGWLLVRWGTLFRGGVRAYGLTVNSEDI